MKKTRHYPVAKKRFSQNFLHDVHIIADIIAVIDPKSHQHLVEIGPGRGALTLPLSTLSGALDAIELDCDLVYLLRQTMAKYAHVAIHHADALTFDYKALVVVGSDQKLRIVGNLPYNITTPLLFHLLAHARHIDDMCFMLQRDVVERICAQPGTKAYGRLSIMVQYQFEVLNLFNVPPAAFHPVPKIESAIIYLRPRAEFVSDVPVEAINKIVMQAFSQRRKTVSNALKNVVFQEDFFASNIDPKQRPETISIKQYAMLTKRWLTKAMR